MTSWTTPRTWITGEVLSSSNFNTHIRDNLISYGGSDAISTTPPASPGNGQRWVFPYDAANGVYWTFIYITAISSWVFAGGPPAFAETVALVTTASTTYVSLSGDPSITLARAGDYFVSVGAAVYGDTSGKWVSPKRGAATAVDNDAATYGNFSGSSSGAPGTAVSRQGILMAGLAASSAIAPQYRTGSGTASFERRWVGVIPRKVT